MRSVNSIQDVVDWGLCVGCGACISVCSKGAVTLVNIEEIGIRPRFDRSLCVDCIDCLAICPGYRIEVAELTGWKEHSSDRYVSLLGPTVGIWEGYSADKEIRYRASSGGLLTALSLYCLEQEDAEFVLHTAMDQKEPWLNTTVQSWNKDELVSRCGSRYSASSPCELLTLIENSDRPCVFIGKPCDVAAVSALRKRRPQLDHNLILVLAFCCAGTPSARATLDLLGALGVKSEGLAQLVYRGCGWPGSLAGVYREGEREDFLPYVQSWSYLQKYRPFRCHLCPDGLGQCADISCCDAWHRYSEDIENPGVSLALVRNSRGEEILQKALNAGYLTLTPAKASDVVKAAQGLVDRRKEVFGRLLAMKLFMIPTPCFFGFSLLRCWLTIRFVTKAKSILGTLRRLIQRGLWHRNPVKAVGN